MPKQRSRTARWGDAVGECRDQYNAVIEAADRLAVALSELNDIRVEYEEWRDNLPENLQGTAVGEKLDAIVDIDIESLASEPLESWSEIESMLDEAEGADMPLGFGRD